MNPSRVVIIPAAGFGTRVGSPDAKELFLHPAFKQPMIEVAIDRALKADAHPVIITRKNKTELIEHIKTHYSEIIEKHALTLQLIEPSREWAHTVLLSEPYWGEHNVLLLPDTDFSPENALRVLFDSTIPLSFATFSVPSPETWGIVGRGTNGDWWIGEKPKKGLPNLIVEPNSPRDAQAWAWGLIGFSNKAGYALFSSILESGSTGKWLPLPCAPTLVPLSQFRDLTR